jgi:hypothetical protein
MKNCIFLFVLFLFLPIWVFAQDSTEHIKIGTELDLFPYATGGYYTSLWAGEGRIRFRAVAAESNIPQFVVNDGFKDMNTKAYALIADYFFNDNYSGLWLGTGVEYWKNKVKNSANETEGKFDNLQLTFGGGYALKIWNNLYINPWGALHLRVSGDSEKNIGGKSYTIRTLLAEASLKIGWYF